MQLTYYDTWNNTRYQNFMKELGQLRDQKYLEFNQKIIFTKYKMIGIRTDTIRKIAREIRKSDFKSFLDCKFMGIYEELFIRGILLSYVKEYEEFCQYLDPFIRLIDNWAICDMCISNYKIVNKNRADFLEKIKVFLNSRHEYVVRVGVVFLMDYYLVDDYIDEVFKLMNDIRCRAYYVDMAIAWLISVAFVKYQDKTIEFLDNNQLDKDIIRMSVQKIRDSKRVEDYYKDYVLKYRKNTNNL